MRRRSLKHRKPAAGLALRATTCLTLAACGSDPAAPAAHLVVDFPAGVVARDVRIEPRALAKRARWIGSRLILSVAPHGNGQLTLLTPGTCPLPLDLTGLEAGETRHHEARRWIDLGPSRTDLGPGSKVRVEATPGCAQAKSGRIVWRAIEGALAALESHENGFVLTGTLPTLHDLFERPLAPTLIPVSPESQGRVVVEARFTMGEIEQIARVELSALSRSRGLPNVPTGASVLLGGTGWKLLDPAVSEPSTLQSYEGYSLLRPAQSGPWLLRGPDGSDLRLRSAAYDQVPLDCTRAGCHENLHGHAAGGMSDVLVRGMGGQLGEDYSPACALACHALGEPGVQDGGFSHVAGMLGVDVSQVTSYAELPAALQRLSNVGCLSCHGPGAIPEPGARARILRSDVCAYCHDAPPRYGHVRAWQESAMSQAARRLTDTTRDDCAVCHTTSGFLKAHAASDAPQHEVPEAPPQGLDCVACHDVHQREPAHALLRSPKPPPSAEHLAAGMFSTSRPCLNCHAPRGRLGSERQAWPEASAAAVWLGRGGFTRTGGLLMGPAVHARAPEGCSSCHVGTTSNVERGKNHGFQANPAACRTCHEHPPPAPEHLSKARSLLAEIARREPALRHLSLPPAGTLPHAHAGELDVSTSLGRAAYNLLLLLEDPAAGIHNPDYTKLLLDHSEGMLRTSAGEPEQPHDE
ncbi:MAG TPA: hypothetical protein VFU02_15045 [Polyangiaceae bacterium]|nr:hypothetical protein [Polyangiaceae bacterium]